MAVAMPTLLTARCMEPRGLPLKRLAGFYPADSYNLHSADVGACLFSVSFAFGGCGGCGGCGDCCGGCGGCGGCGACVGGCGGCGTCVGGSSPFGDYTDAKRTATYLSFPPPPLRCAACGVCCGGLCGTARQSNGRQRPATLDLARATSTRGSPTAAHSPGQDDFGDSPRDLVFAQLDEQPPFAPPFAPPSAPLAAASGAAEEKPCGVDDAAGAPRRRRRGATAGSPGSDSGSPGGCEGGKARRAQLEVVPAPVEAWPEDATTIMLRNVPNRYTAEELLTEVLAQGFEGAFDFFYLPIDFKTKRNRGYSFINFHNSKLAKFFVDAFHAQKLTRYATHKILEVSPALMQGFAANVSHYVRKEAQRIHNPWFRPMIFPREGEAGEACEAEEACRARGVLPPRAVAVAAAA